MNLIWFLTIGAVFSIVLGEFGQFPFGITSASVSVTDILLFLTLMFLLIWKIGIKKDLKLPLSLKILMLFWVVGFGSLIFSGMLEGGVYLVRFIFYSLSVFIGFELTRNTFSFERIANIIVRMGVVLVGLGFLQLLIFPDLKVLTDFGFDPHKNRMFSTILDPNFLGMLINIFFALSLYLYFKLKQKVWIILSIYFAVALFFTFSRSAYLAFVFQILFLGIFKYPKMLLVSAIAFIVLYFAAPNFKARINGGIQIDKTANERIESWNRGMSVFSQNPILGVGFNNLRFVFEKNNLFKVFSPDGGNSGAGVDSSLILVLATTGTVGFLIYISWWVFVAAKVIKSKNPARLFVLSIILALFVNSWFINSLFFPPIMLLYFLILGSYLGEKD